VYVRGIKTFWNESTLSSLHENKYYKERDEFIDKAMYGETQEAREGWRAFYERNKANKIWRTDDLQKQYGDVWRFNEIVGYVRLHFLGMQVRGELFMVDVEKFVRTRKKLLIYQTHKVALERDIPLNASNEEIFEVILQYIVDTRQELKPRYVDSSLFELIGKFVDWKALLKEHNEALQVALD
jgi:hypothetical protein